jgi:hypothetical protein
VLCHLDCIIDTEVCPYKHLCVTVEQHTLCTVVPLLMNTCTASSPHTLMINHWTYYYVISITAQELTETHLWTAQANLFIYTNILLLIFWNSGRLQKLLYCHPVKKCPPPNFMDPEGSVPCLRKPTTCSVPCLQKPTNCSVPCLQKPTTCSVFFFKSPPLV